MKPSQRRSRHGEGFNLARGAPEPLKYVSKKVENHKAALALYTMFYDFGRIHKSLRVTPATEPGVTDHVWSLEEFAMLAQ